MVKAIKVADWFGQALVSVLPVPASSGAGLFPQGNAFQAEGADLNCGRGIAPEGVGPGDG